MKPITYAIGIFLMGAVIALLSVYLYWTYWGHRGVTADEVRFIVKTEITDAVKTMAAPPINIKYGTVHVDRDEVLVREEKKRK